MLKRFQRVFTQPSKTMKSVCKLLVLLALFGTSQSKSLNLTPSFFRARLDQQSSIHLPTIVGGTPTEIASHPHHLAILDLSRGGYLCGASNIHPLWALTAAHCLERGTPPSLINLWGGSTSRITGGHLFFITEYILHPEYDVTYLDSDVALMRVDPLTPLSGHLHVSPIRIPDNCPATEACCGVCPGETIHVAGWGRDDSGELPENLLMVNKDIANQEECNASWSAAFEDITITSRMFCTIVENGIDSCNGDSGSAIVLGDLQVGIVSFGSAVCGDGSLPAVYVRIEDPFVRDFIREHTGI